MDRKILAKPSGEFDEEILADLIDEGYQGAELLEKFKEMRWKIRPAFEAWMADIDRMLENGEFYTMEEVFGADYQVDSEE